MSVSVIALRTLTLLSGLPEEALARLSTIGHIREFARREVVFSKGEEAQFLYFLLSGRLQAVDFTADGREAGLYFVEPGAYCGELAVIDGEKQAEFMLALTKSTVVMIPRHEARTLILSTPTISEIVLTRLAKRLRGVSAQRTLLSLPNPAQRVCAQLLQIATQNHPGTPMIENAPTHQELAVMINTSRETVTRIFQVLQNRSIVRRDGNTLSLEDPAYLQSVAEGKVELPKGG